MTGYLLFCAEHRNQVKKKYSNLSLVEIVKMLSQMWRDCDQTLKDAYNKEYEEELQEYQLRWKTTREDLTNENVLTRLMKRMIVRTVNNCKR
jgi:hypothetical protein